METKITPTEGEFTVYSLGNELSIRQTQSLEEICVVKNKNSIQEMESNAQILSNGLDTYNKCHLLPSQLLQQRDELIQGCEEAITQIEYLHGKFKETGTGNAVIAYLESLIQKHQI